MATLNKPVIRKKLNNLTDNENSRKILMNKWNFYKILVKLEKKTIVF